jgi:hypothetical protein
VPGREVGLLSHDLGVLGGRRGIPDLPDPGAQVAGGKRLDAINLAA